ncbi:hypothetical protein [Streptomyces abyssomicinicus]|nr:hypothetical protein [Streptomyces abyssomicinicus]
MTARPGEAERPLLLRELDDPEWLTWPQPYRGETGADLGGLAARLDDDLG